jgi:hypothetical protein
MNVPDQYILRNKWDIPGSIKIAGISALAAFLMRQYTILFIETSKERRGIPDQKGVLDLNRGLPEL